MKSIYTVAMIGVSATALVSPYAAYAQTAKPAADEATADKEIIVTGTLIRGTQVTGSQTITIDSAAITSKAATSTNELLGTIPQIANNFNGRIEGDPRGYAGSSSSINRPNLRNLPSSGSTSGALTLVLVDGLRLTPVGVNQASIDPDIVPAAVLEGIDVVTDGGSSLYGADAVAGVLNFRTLKKFDGIKIDGNSAHGTTIKGYKAWDATITAGHSWTSGNAYISVGHTDRREVLNGETSWSDGVVYSAAGVASTTFTQCNAPQQTVNRFIYVNIPGRFTGWTNNPQAGGGPTALGKGCDRVVQDSYSPRLKRTNVYAALSQELSDNLDLRVTAYWVNRDIELSSYPRGYTSAAPAIVPPVGAPGTLGAPAASPFDFPQGVGFSFGPNPAYKNTPQRISFETWGVTPELTFKLGSNWQVRTSAHFGRSTNSQAFPGVDTIKTQGYINAGQLNPLNVAAASASVIADVTNYENAQQTKQQMVMLRAIADGSLFALPGGDAKLAIGAEFQDNKADSRLATGAIGLVNSTAYLSAQRNAKSVFAELSLPIFPFLEANGSVRYDNYSDFGSTTNPNIGLSLKPASWLKIFGHWNTSFNAPTAIDNLAIGTGRFACGIYVANSTNPAQRPTDPLGRDTSKQGTCALVLQGSSPGLKPQTADSWAAGFEITPTRGLRIGGEFYSINVKNALGTLNPSVTSTYLTNPDLYTYNITAPQYAAVLATLGNGAALGAQQPSTNIAIVVDTRISNLNAAKISGIDFHALFDADIGAGHLSMGLTGTRATKAFVTNGGVASDQLGIGSPVLFASTFLGWNNQSLSAKVTVNYSGRFTDNANNNTGQPEQVEPFVTTNLGLGYNFKDSGGILSGFSVRLNVDNVFEVLPSYVRRVNTNNPSYVNWTLGRVVKLGASFKF